MKEEFYFFHNIPSIRAQLVNTQDVSKYQAGEDSWSMTWVWRKVEMKCHWFGIKGGYTFPTLNLQPKVHEDHLSRVFTKDPPESTVHLHSNSLEKLTQNWWRTICIGDGSDDRICVDAEAWEIHNWIHRADSSYSCLALDLGALRTSMLLLVLEIMFSKHSWSTMQKFFWGRNAEKLMELPRYLGLWLCRLQSYHSICVLIEFSQPFWWRCNWIGC